jgi:hypothetical protein
VPRALPTLLRDAHDHGSRGRRVPRELDTGDKFSHIAVEFGLGNDWFVRSGCRWLAFRMGHRQNALAWAKVSPTAGCSRTGRSSAQPGGRRYGATFFCLTPAPWAARMLDNPVPDGMANLVWAQPAQGAATGDAGERRLVAAGARRVAGRAD